MAGSFGGNLFCIDICSLEQYVFGAYNNDGNADGGGN